MSGRATRFVSMLALCCSVVAPAHAETPSDLERAKAAFRAGANAYAAADYPAAIQALELAYELTPLPAIAFSLAQAERKQYALSRQPEFRQRAIALFRRYLEQDPNGARRADAQLALLELTPESESSPAAGKEAPPKAQARPTRLMIVSEAPGARISLDGGAAAPSPLIREVAPGRHRAKVVAAGFHETERDVTAVSGELIMNEIALRERPTPLYIWAPVGADVYVDGVYVARGGSRIALERSPGLHQLTVAARGRRVVRRDIVLERGKPRTELVTLEATTQRFVSELCFVGGGVALGAGVIVSALAVRAQNHAEDFLARQQRMNVRPAELVAYNASLLERDRYRLIASVGIAGSLGFFITGLFLRELDSPSLVSAPPRDLNSAQKGAPRSARLTFSPFSPSGEPGAALQLNF